MLFGTYKQLLLNIRQINYQREKQVNKENIRNGAEPQKDNKSKAYQQENILYHVVFPPESFEFQRKHREFGD